MIKLFIGRFLIVKSIEQMYTERSKTKFLEEKLNMKSQR